MVGGQPQQSEANRANFCPALQCSGAGRVYTHIRAEGSLPTAPAITSAGVEYAFVECMQGPDTSRATATLRGTSPLFKSLQQSASCSIEDHAVRRWGLAAAYAWEISAVL